MLRARYKRECETDLRLHALSQPQAQSEQYNHVLFLRARWCKFHLRTAYRDGMLDYITVECPFDVVYLERMNGYRMRRHNRGVLTTFVTTGVMFRENTIRKSTIFLFQIAYIRRAIKAEATMCQ